METTLYANSRDISISITRHLKIKSNGVIAADSVADITSDEYGVKMGG
jgi:hypothetical protein